MIEITKDNVEEVLKNKTVVVKFGAPWCNPCKSIAPVFENIAKTLDGEVEFATCDIDNNYELAANCKIKSVPAFILMKDGIVIDTVVGALNPTQLEEAITNMVKG